MAKLSECTACPLHQGRTQVVQARGDHTSGVMLVGEAPAVEEDAKGYAFAGPAGLLLSNIIARAFSTSFMGESDLWITNAVKCVTPENRIPEAAELGACASWLDKELKFVKPWLIVALGKTAASHLVPGDWSTGFLAACGTVYVADNASPMVLVTYHPSYVLRKVETGDQTFLGTFESHLKWVRTMVDGPQWVIRRFRHEAGLAGGAMSINGVVQ